MAYAPSINLRQYADRVIGADHHELADRVFDLLGPDRLLRRDAVNDMRRAGVILALRPDVARPRVRHRLQDIVRHEPEGPVRAMAEKNVRILNAADRLFQRSFGSPKVR